MLKLLAQTEGREKVSKLVQYGAKLVGEILKHQNNGVVVVGGWTESLARLDKDVADVRTYLRMFKWADELAKLVPSEPTTDLVVLSSLRALSMAVYLVFNNVLWLVKHGLVRGDAPALARRGFTFWVVACVAALAADIRRCQVARNVVALQKTPEQKKAAVARVSALQRMIVRDVCNLQVSAALRGIGPLQYAWLTGFSGVLESLLALCTMLQY